MDSKIRTIINVVVVISGWIAHVKEVHGVPTLRGANRARRERDIEPGPPEKREAIEEALRHFGMI
ncbi:MAG: hypothetical protein A2146_00360 [Actinobacteria bacterium RBG_16_67_10]|nr:MAG: hypothetical protein A2146_00360 [Actinobacteria bacterium RBG_16_67_10]OGK88491.1 MAG: hypothetical protein A2X52_13115 [Candidatus Rokubacteria bacterium GWC2_70_16]OGL19970.1 MAG: hypothetical protein A3K12_01685 [Candidatus Rokubacteria bacterium RIFCSPLOWO2_12_FULL_71_19]